MAKAELKYCFSCMCYVPHIEILERKRIKNFCLICCKKSKITQKAIITISKDSRCEYCQETISYNGDKNRTGRRFCNDKSCAHNQATFINDWKKADINTINKKILQLFQRIDEFIMIQNGTLSERERPVSLNEIGIIRSRILILYNIIEDRRMFVTIS